MSSSDEDSDCNPPTDKSENQQASDPLEVGPSSDEDSDCILPEVTSENQQAPDPFVEAGEERNDELDNPSARGRFQRGVGEPINRLSGSERQDLSDALEHIITVGNCYRHQFWRMKEYHDRRRMKDQQDENKNETTAAAPTATEPATILHNSSVAGSGGDTGKTEEQGTGYHWDEYYQQHKEATKEGDQLSSADVPQQRNTKQSRKRKSNDALPTKDVVDIHAADLRLYSSNLWEMNAWPKTKNSRFTDEGGGYSSRRNDRRKNDEAWQNERGDRIHPLAFSKLKLSAQQHKSDPDNGISSKHNVIARFKDNAIARAEILERAAAKAEASHFDPNRTGCCSVNILQAPRALLLRCWERSVHAASTSILVDTTLDNQNERSRTGTDDGSASNSQSSSLYSSDQARLICRSLNIGLDATNSEPLFCPVCRVDFDSKKRLEEHYFGNQKQQGCCWIKISEERRNILDRVLQSEVKLQTEQMLRVIMQQSKEAMLLTGSVINNGDLPKRTRPTMKQKRERLFNWQHVLKVLDKELESKVANASVQQSIGDAVAAVTETLQTSLAEETTSTYHKTSERMKNLEKSVPPVLVINPQIMRTVSRRLTERYAKIPR